jgi:cytochrome c oxidase assembly factor CtaG
VATYLAAVTALLASAAFAHGFVRLRRRGRADLAGWDRVVLFGLAVALWLVALSPPLDDLADRLLAAHMLEHVLIGDAVAALVLVAVRGPLLFFLLPPSVLRPLARTAWLRRLAHGLTRPGVAFVVWAGAIGVWHVPALYDRTLELQWLHGLQHASFVLGGFLVWNVLVDPAGRRALTVRMRLAYAGVLFVAGQMLANTLILTYTPLYAAYAAQAHRPFGMSAVGDQDLAGLVMIAEQIATLGTFAAIQLRRWWRAPVLVGTADHPLTA